MELLDLTSSDERETALGPLAAASVNSCLPTFGPDKFTSSKSISDVQDAMRKLLSMEADMVVDDLASSELMSTQTLDRDGSTEERTGSQISQLPSHAKRSPKEEILTPDNSRNEASTSRELHEKSHHSTLSRFPSSKAMYEDLDHVVLNRARAGYLFDCDLNKEIVEKDPWLNGIWEWVAGTFLSPPFVSCPLVLTIWQVQKSWLSMIEWSQRRLI